MAGRSLPRRDGHSSGTHIAARLEQPTRTTGPGNRPLLPCGRASSLFGFAPGGACHAVPVAGSAVRSYRTFSPLPAAEAAGGSISVALSLGSPPPDVIRHRVSVEPGLSSPCGLSALAERGCPANWQALTSPWRKETPALSANEPRNRSYNPVRPYGRESPDRHRCGRSRPNSSPPPRCRPSEARCGRPPRSRHRDSHAW